MPTRSALLRTVAASIGALCLATSLSAQTETFIGKRPDEKEQHIQKRLVQKQPFHGCKVICIADTEPKHFRKTS